MYGCLNSWQHFLVGHIFLFSFAYLLVLIEREVKAVSAKMQIGRIILVNNLLKKYTIRQLSSSISVMAPIKVGDKIPSVDLFEDSPANKINTSDLASNKKIIIFGVPGAFTPGCSKTHLPGYVSSAETLKSDQKIDDIVCVSVNDPFVMSAWGKEHNAAGKVRMLADPAASFAKALDLTIDLPPLGGVRAKRFSMVVENGEVKELNVEPDGTGLSCSLATNIGKK